MENQYEKNKKKLPIVFAVIPIILSIIDIAAVICLFYNSVFFDLSAGSIFAGLFSFLGIFVLPSISIVFEVIGLILSIRRKIKPLKIVFPIEIVMTVFSGAFAVFFLMFLRLIVF